MSDETCWTCGFEECQCYLYEVVRRIEKLEERAKKTDELLERIDEKIRKYKGVADE